MTKLKQILGAILNDITKAQAISDAYSRDLKPSYRDDPFLKLLSVPRTEIKEVTLDLKFAINSLKYDTTPILYVDYREKGVNGQNVNQVEFGTPDGAVLGMYRRMGANTWVEESIAEGSSKVISQFNETGRDQWSVYLESITGSDRIQKKSVQLDLNTQDITVTGISENEPTYRLLSASADSPENLGVDRNIEDLDIEVATNELTSLSEATLSSISIKLNIISV